jgi:hypothetical protein
MEALATQYPQNFVSVLQYIPEDILARSVVLGTTGSFILGVWKIWRSNVYRKAKRDILELEKVKEKLEKERNARTNTMSPTEATRRDKEIMQLEHNLKKLLAPVASYALAHNILPPSLQTI